MKYKFCHLLGPFLQSEVTREDINKFYGTISIFKTTFLNIEYQTITHKIEGRQSK